MALYGDYASSGKNYIGGMMANIAKELLDLKAKYRTAYPNARTDLIGHKAILYPSLRMFKRLLDDMFSSGCHIHPSDYDCVFSLDGTHKDILCRVVYKDGTIIEYDKELDKFVLSEKSVKSSWFSG